MKIFKLILGTIAGLWTIGVAVGAAPALLSGNSSTRGITQSVAGVAAIAICGVITLWLFQSALGSEQGESDTSESDEDSDAS